MKDKQKNGNKGESNYDVALRKIAEGDTAGVFKMLYQMAYIGGERRSEVNAKLIEKLNEQHLNGNESAKFMLYTCYCGGDEPQPEKALALFMPLAEKGDWQAQCIVGNIYYNLLKDTETAIEWYKRAANQGSQFAKLAIEDIEIVDTEPVKVGIFWVVPNGKGGQNILYKNERYERSEADSRGFINYRYSHFEIWDNVKGKRTDGCYYYPRGRVIFNVKEDKHVIYVDECINFDAIEEVIGLFDINAYELRQDEHYVCPKCQKKKGVKR